MGRTYNNWRIVTRETIDQCVGKTASVLYAPDLRSLGELTRGPSIPDGPKTYMIGRAQCGLYQESSPYEGPFPAQNPPARRMGIVDGRHYEEPLDDSVTHVIDGVSYQPFSQGATKTDPFTVEDISQLKLRVLE